MSVLTACSLASGGWCKEEQLPIVILSSQNYCFFTLTPALNFGVHYNKKIGETCCINSSSHRLSCGEKGIRTLGTQSVQRFSRPPRSTTPASLQWSKIKATNPSLCGDRGIRTPGALLHNGFQDRRYRPLSHISAAKVQKLSLPQVFLRKKTFLPKIWTFSFI